MDDRQLGRRGMIYALLAGFAVALAASVGFAFAPHGPARLVLLVLGGVAVPMASLIYIAGRYRSERKRHGNS